MKEKTFYVKIVKWNLLASIIVFVVLLVFSIGNKVINIIGYEEKGNFNAQEIYDKPSSEELMKCVNINEEQIRLDVVRVNEGPVIRGNDIEYHLKYSGNIDVIALLYGSINFSHFWGEKEIKCLSRDTISLTIKNVDTNYYQQPLEIKINWGTAASPAGDGANGWDGTVIICEPKFVRICNWIYDIKEFWVSLLMFLITAFSLILYNVNKGPAMHTQLYLLRSGNHTRLPSNNTSTQSTQQKMHIKVKVRVHRRKSKPKH